MCEYSGRLIAWMDGELADQEVANVEGHVGKCAECQRAVSGYAEVSAAFLAGYEAALGAQPQRKTVPWAVGVVAAAAAILAAIFFAQPRAEKLSVFVPSPPHAPAIAFEKPSGPMVRVRSRRSPARAPARTPWIAVEPSVEVALPADALFPPGAVPQGFSFIAEVRP